MRQLIQRTARKHPRLFGGLTAAALVVILCAGARAWTYEVQDSKADPVTYQLLNPEADVGFTA